MSVDEEALAIAYRLHYGAVVRFLAAFAGAAVDAEDLAQEVFLRLGRPECQVPRDRVRFWLLRVARNLALNDLRRRRRDAPLEAIAGAREPSRDPEAALLARTRVEQSIEALQSLPDESRTMLLLREVEEMSYAEIAAMLDVSIAKVKTDLFRARLRLRDALRRMS